MSVHVHGIRHHGPGSARSLLRALEELRPDVVLIEGPPDAEPLVALAAHAAMAPPVALLVYDPEAPRRCAFYPFAEFSPEWQAIRYALANQVPVRFMDLPQMHELALQRNAEEEMRNAEERRQESGDRSQNEEDGETGQQGDRANEEIQNEADGGDCEIDGEDEGDALSEARRDPLALLARAAGYDDSERWWEHLVEERRESDGLFTAIREAMTALRSELCGTPAACDGEREARREAWMRQTIRAAEKEGFERIAVVCGAWHAPALAEMPPARQDAATLKGLPKLKVQATWIPWTYGRLARESGYGAGVISPGWYDFLWRHGGQESGARRQESGGSAGKDSGDTSGAEAKGQAEECRSRQKRPTALAIGWLAKVAALLRGKDLDVSTAHVIEAVRLAEALAAMRGRPAAGLPELNDATLAVILHGEAAPLGLIYRELIVGERLGEVPEEVPAVPLQQDLQRQQKALRLPASADFKDYDLDLRKPNDLARSQLLHRLRLLGIEWGQVINPAVRSKGTFREAWRVQWSPELSVSLIEAGVWGNTVESAATASALHRAGEAKTLAELTYLIDAVLLADLPEAVREVMARLEAEAAVASDVSQMMEALPPLAAVVRYGNVRGTDGALVGRVVEGLVARICIGLGDACASLDDEAAGAMYARVVNVESAILTLENPELLAPWREALCRLAEREGLHGLVAGRACRILLDGGALAPDETARRMGLALSRGADPLQGGAWLEGFLRGSGMLLLHTDALWAMIDAWVSSLGEEAFREILPVLRRTFATFPAPERRMMGERVKREGARQISAGMSSGVVAADTPDLDLARAEKILPVLGRILGFDGGTNQES